MACIDTSSIEYQTLKNRSGISEFVLDAYSSEYLDRYGRYPYLDELPGVDSSKEFLQRFNVKDESAKVQDILTETNSSTIEEAVIKINNEYADLETDIHQLAEEAIVVLRNRPNEYTQVTEQGNIDIEATRSDNAIILNTIFDKLERLYGITIIPITSEEINQTELKNISLEVNLAKAFIYKNNIYVNTDLATIDSPLHELMHIFLGSIRYTNPDLYYLLILLVITSVDPINYQLLYPNRTLNDLGEEILVGEFSKHLLGQENLFSLLESATRHEIFYNINRVIDSILFGEISVKAIEDTDVMRMSLLDIAKRVNSSVFNRSFKGSLDDASVHRMLANKKQRLLESKELKEICY